MNTSEKILDTVDISDKVLSDLEKLYIWLYNGTNLLSFEEIIRIADQYNIPSNIILYKFIAQLLRDGINKNAIISKLRENNVLIDYDVDKLRQIIFLSIISRELTSLPLTKDIFEILVGIATRDHVIYDTPRTHTAEYPSVHEINGRPYLNWKECYYDDCHLKFHSSQMLVQHLTKLGKYTPRFHTAHENIVKIQDLTPEKVIASQMTRCPSFVCNKSKVIFTPEELCNHFMNLGIKPFWYPGAIIQPCTNTLCLDFTCYDKIYLSDDCGICLEEPTSTIVLPCYHSIMCLKCSFKVTKCPMCRGPISRVLPF
jgi:hypothetical protein